MKQPLNSWLKWLQMLIFGVIQSFGKVFPSLTFSIPLVPPRQVVTTKVGKAGELEVVFRHPGADCNKEAENFEEDSQVAEGTAMFTELSENDMYFCTRKKVQRDFTTNRQGLNPLLKPLDQAASCTTQAL